MHGGMTAEKRKHTSQDVGRFIMKKRMLLLLAVSVLSLSMKAQEKNVFYKKGYAPSIEIGGTFVDSFGFRPEVLTSHGYCFGNGLYVGGGLGLGFEHWTMKERENRFFVPVFVDLKYSFLNQLASPFVGIKAGAMLDCTGLGIGYMVLPSIGVDIWRFSLSLGFQNYSCTYNVPTYNINGSGPGDIDATISGIGKGGLAELVLR